ncbi:MAG: Holliday junction branch migration DNA helicase RuvB [Candidatus Gribaldobacteria bacterium]|nr:Holliday junction branch migration DNA helicase RuvB [Candidatus Gribaldobacteria bacterium]
MNNLNNQGKKGSQAPVDDILDSTLRPKDWENYVGQDKVKQNLKVIIEAAQQRKESPEHLLLYGNPGLGKTTLAYLISQEIGADIRITSGPALERSGDLAAILTNLTEGSVLFVDEIHRLSRVVEECLYPAMEEFKLNLILGKGPMARIMELKVPRFTLIGATTKLASMSSPLRSRFGATFGLNFYTLEDIQKILTRSSRLLNVEIEDPALSIIAKTARFTPRVANHLLRRVRDFAQVRGQGIITKDSAQNSLQSVEIDESGLTNNDQRILEALIHKFAGGPVGLKTLASATAEEEDTILDIYEPYLMRLGLIALTPRGRVATKLAFEHLGLKPPSRLL